MKLLLKFTFAALINLLVVNIANALGCQLLLDRPMDSLSNNEDVYRFDFMRDEFLGAKDPRIKSFIYVAKLHEQQALIVYNNSNARSFVKKLATNLSHNGVKVLKPSYTAVVNGVGFTSRYVMLVACESE